MLSPINTPKDYLFKDKQFQKMEENASKLLNKLAGYKIRIKELHWDASNMSLHKLCDDVTDKLYGFEDSLAEELQTLYGKIQPGDIKEELPKAIKLNEFLAELLQDVYQYYGHISDAKYIGVRSVVEGFIHELNVCIYLCDMTKNENVQKKHTPREVIVSESTFKRVVGSEYEHILKESIGAESISGQYDLENGSVFIDDDENFISVKSKDGEEIFTKQGQEMRNLFDAFKAEKMRSGDFNAFLNNWVADLQKNSLVQ